MTETDVTNDFFPDSDNDEWDTSNTNSKQNQSYERDNYRNDYNRDNRDYNRDRRPNRNYENNNRTYYDRSAGRHDRDRDRRPRREASYQPFPTEAPFKGYFSNVSYDATDKDVREFMDRFGNVVDFSKFKDGRFIVTFSTAEELQAFIDTESVDFFNRTAYCTLLPDSPSFALDWRSSNTATRNPFGRRDDRDRRPRYEDRDRRPRYDDRERRPRYEDRERRPRYNDRPRYEDRENRYERRDERPRYENRDERPRYENRDERPRYENRDRRPRYDEQEGQSQGGSAFDRLEQRNKERAARKRNRVDPFGNARAKDDFKLDKVEVVATQQREEESAPANNNSFASLVTKNE
ncbi:hypothetical protein PCE1_002531 [Barthelona sp. PCE]